MTWWQILLLYIIGGSFTIYFMEIWDPAKPEDRSMYGLAFLFWWLIVGIGITWLILNFPQGVAWCARKARKHAGLDPEKNEDD